MEKLISILREFDAYKSKLASLDDEAIALCFEPVANKVLNNGHFVIQCVIGKMPVSYGIRIDTMELYFHEEIPGGYIDPIMYHSNWRLPESMKKLGMKSYPYFEFGSFNLHTSGVDVTFENEDKQYRASFLIRAFSIIESSDTVLVPNSGKPDECSTHIFDYLFPNGVSASAMKNIHWKEDKFSGGSSAVGRYVRKGAKVFRPIPEKGNKYEKTEKDCPKRWQFGKEIR